ncbi:hypothetical protein HanRHA438_Chr05g0231671 [Helianthus annuus]|uniref:Transposase (Putative), gypsy type n=1 Tax=Helianthus annuus TaxID=4232 RepID=A0A9K3J0Q3_HELAN|nr:hypothetical protein HanXRQr2_Chr05g0222581 [Helianthus annuus]KAJ0570793.1 hypothetical protein HanHA300_Chr05g0182151 [Helianthus annuus]KAJ0577748.1 hypothetical protein HanIR_Chr05g0239541 [Helianthus annuus]KAJ0585133.1 hypothetical protein HanHA89_Chr05g0196821 [Helianthus annuus]KAJ0919615.1 hypothetical protein HanRHA438_Chr05g0231671 [Helianthus annuus]
MFNLFYYVSYTGGFYSFNSRTSGVNPCSANPPKSLHDWKQKFFYIRRGVIPIDMHYLPESEGVPRVNVSIYFVDQEWYKVLTRKVTSIIQLEERASVAAGMSMLWAPQNPRGVPIYGYQGKEGYSLMNVLDPKAGGAMVVATLAGWRPLWLDQIRDRFLHPTSESFAAYANTILGDDGGDDLDDLESRKKKTLDKSEKKKKKKVEGSATEAPRKRPSTLPFLDYVVISDTLSGLDAGDKRVECDPDDDATLTEMMKKRKTLEEKKKELDDQATAALAVKKSKLQKETPPAPSESEVDLGVFSAKHGNLLEKIFAASCSQGVRSGKAPRKIDISKITPPTSPPSRTFDLSPPPADRGKRKEDDVEVEQVGEGGGNAGVDAGGAGVVGSGGGGDDVVEESSEATPHHTVYTKVVRGSSHGGASRVHHSLEYEHVQGGSCDTQNPACANLPHAPRWNLTQGSRMTELANCREFFSLPLPPAERLFQKRRNRLDLLDDHIHAGVNFFATSQEITREWQLMGEDTLEFENVKKAVTDAEEKLAKEKQLNVNKQKDWEVACERTNKELQAQRDAIVRLSGEKKKISDEAEEERVAHQKREQEYIQHIAKLEKFAAEKVGESKPSEILVEEIIADCKWLLARAVPLISEHIAGSEELAKYMYELGEAAYDRGRKEGYAAGRSAVEKKEALKDFDLYKVNCAARYAEKRQEFESLEFAIVKAAGKLSRKPDGIALLKKALGDEDREVGDAGTSRQE